MTSSTSTLPLPLSAQDLKSYLNSLPEWHDEQKCLSLFSSFRGSLEDAAESWSIRLHFWKSLIYYTVPRKWVGNRNILTFEEQKLPHYYQRKGASPLGLSIVLKNMIDLKELTTVSDFLDSKPLSLTSRMTFFLKEALFSSIRWSGSKIYQTLFDSEEGESGEERAIKGAQIDSNGLALDREFIVMASVRLLAESVMHIFKSQARDFVDSCLSMHEFKHIMTTACSYLDWSSPTEKDTVILLHYMSLHFSDVLMEQTDSLTHFSPEAKAIFIRSSHMHLTDSNLSSIFKSVVELKEAIRTLESQMIAMDSQISKYDGMTKKYLFTEKNKEMALQTAKRKKQVQKSQERLSEALANLEALLNSIRSSKTNEQVLKAYQVGSQTVNYILSNKELSIEAVDMTMNTMLDAIQDAQEMERTIVLGNANLSSIVSEADEQDLERELEDLICASQKEKAADVDKILEQLESLKMSDAPLTHAAQKEALESLQEKKSTEPSPPSAPAPSPPRSLSLLEEQ